MGTLSIVALLHGPDRPGLVARVAGWIFEQGGNILHADQHRDAEENVFFQRVEWSQPSRGGYPSGRGILQSDGTSGARHGLPDHDFKRAGTGRNAGFEDSALSAGSRFALSTG